MRFTAWFVVKAIELSGIPVYRDGFMLSIPGGDFEVAKACSGIRYLIASLSLGSFFAYLTFRSLSRRLIFVAAAFVLPILANGLRAYGIVLIAHLSNMQYAVGVDHLIYGWLFFGVLMFLMFFVGGRFAEHDDEPSTAPLPMRGRPVTAPAMVVPALAVIAIVLGPSLAQRALAGGGGALVAATVPVAVDGWRKLPADGAGYVPAFKNFDDLKRVAYESPLGTVGVTVHSYTDRQAELVRAGNIFIGTKGHKIIRNEPVQIKVGAVTWTVGHIDMLEFAPRRMILYWYQVGERRTNSPNVAKLYEWVARLRGKPTRRALVTVSTPMAQGEDVSQVLLAFLRVHGERLALCVSAPDSADCVRPGAGD
jgi:EpsI family protein